MSLPALPNLIKTYSVRANAPFQDVTTATKLAQSLVFSLKEHMKNTLATGTTSGSRNANSVWTVLGSSDSATQAMDAVDRWTDITKLVWAANGSAHSWIVLRNTTLGYDCLIDLNAAASTSVRVAFTESATPFGGGTLTSGPTATNEFTGGSTNSGVTTNATLITDTTTGNFNWTHYVTADDGQFFFLVSRTGLGLFPTFLALQKTINPQTGDTRNIFTMLHSLSSSRGAPAYATVSQTAAGCVGRSPSGAANTTGGIQNAGTWGATAWVGANTIDGLSGNYPAYPCHIASMTSHTYRGQLPDFNQLAQAQVGASYPSAAAQDRIIAGDYIVPFPSINPTT